MVSAKDLLIGDIISWRNRLYEIQLIMESRTCIAILLDNCVPDKGSPFQNRGKNWLYPRPDDPFHCGDEVCEIPL